MNSHLITKRAVSLFFATLFFAAFLPSWAEEKNFVCEPDKEWTSLFDRTDGWLFGDGIFSYGMDGNSKQGSTGEHSQTVFHFSDSLIGNANADGTFKPGLVMVNHCFAVLEGSEPEQTKMQFFYNTDTQGKPANLFDRRFWLGDGIVIDSVLYTTGTVVDPKTWAMEGPWLISVPVHGGKIDFTQTKTQRVELFHKNAEAEVLFGIGICDCGEDIYVYGFRDEKTPFFPRQLIVAKVPRDSFGNVAAWQFWTGKQWSSQIADCNSSEAALASGMSNELSVTKMNGGCYDGKYILVYTENCITEKLNYAVADTPFSSFSKPVTFYRCPEPKQYEEEVKRTYGPKAHVITYNAKAHPRLSPSGELLVSYNLNIWGMKDGMFFTSKTQGFPRFVRLKFISR
ncbi:hypothetical protein FACS18942_02910 [Planctomycetales bacterium]|nr:hypothetical protein FACS18942_02910 [Planctomycetales bacterium]GHT35084.1 hypothetical protein FACS189427_03640 [Planctomycetales bacterium]